MEGAGVGKTTVSGDHMQVRVEPLELAEGVHGYGRAGCCIITGGPLFKVGAEHLPGAAAQFSQQFSIKQKVDPQPLRDGKNPLTVGAPF